MTSALLPENRVIAVIAPVLRLLERAVAAAVVIAGVVITFQLEVVVAA